MQRKHIFTVFITLALISTVHSACNKLLEEKPKATAQLDKLDASTLEQLTTGAYEPLDAEPRPSLGIYRGPGL